MVPGLAGGGPTYGQSPPASVLGAGILVFSGAWSGGLRRLLRRGPWRRSRHSGQAPLSGNGFYYLVKN
jgi:hypothetical protein